MNDPTTNKEFAKRQFEALKLHDPTVKKVWGMYRYGDLSSYQESLRAMIILLAMEKHDLQQRLVHEVQNRPAAGIYDAARMGDG